MGNNTLQMNTGFKPEVDVLVSTFSPPAVALNQPSLALQFVQFFHLFHIFRGNCAQEILSLFIFQCDILGRAWNFSRSATAKFCTFWRTLHCTQFFFCTFSKNIAVFLCIFVWCGVLPGWFLFRGWSWLGNVAQASLGGWVHKIRAFYHKLSNKAKNNNNKPFLGNLFSLVLKGGATNKVKHRNIESMLLHMSHGQSWKRVGSTARIHAVNSDTILITTNSVQICTGWTTQASRNSLHETWACRWTSGTSRGRCKHKLPISQLSCIASFVPSAIFV